MNAMMTANGFGGVTTAFANCTPRRIIRREPPPRGGVGLIGLMAILLGLCAGGIVVGGAVQAAVIAATCSQQVVEYEHYDCREPVALQ